ncbi:MAG: 3-hydroxyacyl-CoA dehydrogenase [Bacteroidetes bacterium]|nr:3-hydroxyacyl-CoA dehydrogenase [Bacteroidota bacterium]
MQTGILGSASAMQAWQQFAGENTSYTPVQDSRDAKNFDLFIDLNFDTNPERISHYAGNIRTVFLLNTVCCTAESAMVAAGLKWSGETIFGINAVPTFLQRSLLEISNPFGLDTKGAESIAHSLGYAACEWVQSRVGMVTPRIVCMIINEAFYTLQEGTAGAGDIDAAMRLGTNYPMGPFEWCDKMGLDYVYTILDAVYTDTREERYKICPALKQAWVRSQISG